MAEQQWFSLSRPWPPSRVSSVRCGIRRRFGRPRHAQVGPETLSSWSVKTNSFVRQQRRQRPQRHRAVTITPPGRCKIAMERPRYCGQRGVVADGEWVPAALMARLHHKTANDRSLSIRESRWESTTSACVRGTFTKGRRRPSRRNGSSAETATAATGQGRGDRQFATGG